MTPIGVAPCYADRMNAPTRPIPLRPDPLLARESAVASYIRAVTAQSLSVISGSRAEPAEAILRRGWPADRDAVAVAKAASNPASLGNPPWAGVLSFQRAADFVGTLAPSSCGMALLQKCLRFEWPEGVSSLLIPSINVDQTRTPWWQEGVPIGVVMFQTGISAPITPAKISTIVVLSSEILNYSLPNAELMVKTALDESVGLSIDTALLGTAAATAATPAGLFHGIAPLPAANGSIPSENAVEDIANCVSAVNAVSGNHPVTLIASFKQAASLRARLDIGAFDILPCATLPANTLAAVASNGLASIGDSVPDFAVSKEASLHMDDAPQNLGSVPVTKTMWQTDMVAIKLKFRLSWILRDPRAVAWVQGCAW
jgi:hypothetical protein